LKPFLSLAAELSFGYNYQEATFWELRRRRG